MTELSLAERYKEALVNHKKLYGIILEKLKKVW